MSVGDLSMIASLCAMAVLDRKQLKTRFYSNQNIKQLLESEPVWRDLVEHLLSCRYADFVTGLQRLKVRLCLISIKLLYSR
jgi:hypothetical protein